MQKSKLWLDILLLIMAIYLVSIVQIYLLQLFPNLIEFKKSIHFMLIGYSWIGGIVTDIMSLLFLTLPSLFLKKHMSPLPLGLFFYISSHLLYGFPCLFLNYQSLPIYLQSFVKVLEFIIIMSFDWLCIAVFPDFVYRQIKK